MANYNLSQPAEIDLEDIFDYSYDQFGIDQAIAYQNQLFDTLGRPGNFPESGISRDDIRKGLRFTISGGHIIFYRLKKQEVFILRILHHSRDVKKYL
ncbi:MAG: type II toxin-antitoxin system RelE/ParE family toxin [Cyclobacteriaceae bacterium]